MRELHTVKLWYRSPGSRHYAWLLPQARARTLPAVRVDRAVDRRGE
jgi:hypothetical protein